MPSCITIGEQWQETQETQTHSQALTQQQHRHNWHNQYIPSSSQTVECGMLPMKTRDISPLLDVVSPQRRSFPLDEPPPAESPVDMIKEEAAAEKRLYIQD